MREYTGRFAKAWGAFVGLTGLLFVFASVPTTLSAAELNVAPKHERTIYRSSNGKFVPGKLKYRLSASDGDTVRWRLRSAPRWFAADPLKGKAGSNKTIVVFSPVSKKVKKLDPGIYSRKIRFSYKNAGKSKRVRRNVTLIVEGDPQAGLDVYMAKCSGCHDLDQNGAGPYLRDVYGRKAGTANGYNHSDELTAYGEVWEERNLNEWLTDPQALVPGANMFLLLSKRTDRMDVIAHLKRISP